MGNMIYLILYTVIRKIYKMTPETSYTQVAKVNKAKTFGQNMSSLFDKEDLEDTKGVMRIRKTQWSKEKGQKDQQRSTKHYTEN